MSSFEEKVWSVLQEAKVITPESFPGRDWHSVRAAVTLLRKSGRGIAGLKGGKGYVLVDTPQKLYEDSQVHRIMSYIQSQGYITENIGATLGIGQTHTRINDLREKGFPIKLFNRDWGSGWCLDEDRVPNEAPQQQPQPEKTVNKADSVHVVVRSLKRQVSRAMHSDRYPGLSSEHSRAMNESFSEIRKTFDILEKVL